MSKIEKILRVLFGFVILVYFGLFYPTWWAFLGLIPLVTGVSEFCPFYILFKRKNRQSKENLEQKTHKNRKFLKRKKHNNNTDESLFKD